MPVGIAVAPLIFNEIIAAHGWRALVSGLGVAFFMLTPIGFLTRSAPVETSDIAGTFEGRGVQDTGGTLAGRDLGQFCIVALAAGLLLSGTVVMSTHIVNIGSVSGLTQSQAALLLSILGAAAALGAFLFGWFADRSAPVTAMLVNAIGQAAMWAALLWATSFQAFIVITLIFGLCAGGTFPCVVGTLISTFGGAKLGTLVGYLTLMVVPFSFGMPPLIGLIFDWTKQFSGGLILECACSIGALLLMSAYRVRQKG